MFSGVVPMVLNTFGKVGRMPDYFCEPSVLGLSGFKQRLRFSVKILRTIRENLSGYHIYLTLGDEKNLECMKPGFAWLTIQSGYCIGREGVQHRGFYNQMSK